MPGERKTMFRLAVAAVIGLAAAVYGVFVWVIK